MTEIQEKLNASIPPHFISERSGLSYVTGAYVKSRLNEVFGWDGWNYEVISCKPDWEKCACFAHVRLTVNTHLFLPIGDKGTPKQFCTTSDGLAWGYASGRDGNEAFDFAIAESVTDALKRAAVRLGNSMGLELYPMSKGAPEPPKDVIAEIPVVKDFANAIAEASALDILKSIGQDIAAADLSASSRGGLHDLFVAKKKELEG